MNPKGPTFIFNILVAIGIQLIHHFYDADRGLWEVEENYPKGVFLLFILLMWVVGLFQPRPKNIVISDNMGAYFLSLGFLGAVGAGLIGQGMLGYFGVGGEKSFTIMMFVVVVLFLVEVILFVMIGENEPAVKRNRKGIKSKKILQKTKSSRRFSNIYLSIYAILGMTYVWQIIFYLGKMEHHNIGQLLVQIFGVSLGFIFVGLPFRRYLILDQMVSGERESSWELYFSYLILFVSAIYPLFG